MTKSKFAGSTLAKGFLTDKALEDNGVWRQHDETGIWAKVRRSSRPEYRTILRRHFKPFAQLSVLPPKTEDEIKMKAVAEGLLADWGQTRTDADGEAVFGKDGKPERGPLLDGDGAEIRCTFENALEAFKEMPDFWRWVQDEADLFENFRVAAVQEDIDPLSGISASSTNGASPNAQPSSNDEQRAANA